MTSDSIIQIAAQLSEMAARYNAVMKTKKVRPRHAVAEEAHKLVWNSIEKLKDFTTDESELIIRAEEMLTDIRWGRPTSKF